MTRSPARPSATVRAQVQWSDTDASGHYHFTTAFRLFEAAEAELFAGLGLLSETSGRLPRVHASADFKRALHFRDVVTVQAVVEDVGRASLTLGFEIRRDGELCVEGRVVTVLLTRAEGELARWSDAQRARLGGQPENPRSDSPS